MNPPKKPEGFSVIPKSEHPCLWMMAGVIAYKLCERDYQCDTCPLDMEMRHTKAEIPGHSTGYRKESDRNPALHALLFYSPNHTWVRLEGSKGKPKAEVFTLLLNGQSVTLSAPIKAIVGVDDFILRLISKVNRIVLPKLGTQISRGDTLVTLIQDANAFPITAPISGRVVKLNAELLENPKLMMQDPAGKGWLAYFRPNNLMAETKGLLVGLEALAWQQKESRKLETLIGTLRKEDRQRLGAMMPDGKQGGVDSLLQIMGPESYHRMVLSFLKREFD